MADDEVKIFLAVIMTPTDVVVTQLGAGQRLVTEVVIALGPLVPET